MQRLDYPRLISNSWHTHSIRTFIRTGTNPRVFFVHVFSSMPAFSSEIRTCKWTILYEIWISWAAAKEKPKKSYPHTILHSSMNDITFTGSALAVSIWYIQCFRGSDVKNVFGGLYVHEVGVHDFAFLVSIQILSVHFFKSHAATQPRPCHIRYNICSFIYKKIITQHTAGMFPKFFDNTLFLHIKSTARHLSSKTSWIQYIHTSIPSFYSAILISTY